MKNFYFIRMIFISLLFFSLSKNVYAKTNINYEYENIIIQIGLDCDRKTSSLSVLMKIENKKKESIYLSEDQLLLMQNMPNVFELIPSSFSGENGYKYAAPYIRPIKIDSLSAKPKKSSFRLYPNEAIVIRNPISSFYKLDFNVDYNVTTFYSYLLGNKKDIFSSQINFTIESGCFDAKDIIWLDRVIFTEGAINRIPIGDEKLGSM